MKDGYHLDVDTLYSFIYEIYSDAKLYRNYKLEFDSSTDKSETEYYTCKFLKAPFNKLQPLHITIGTKSFVEYADGDYVRDEDVVHVVWSLYHELSHVHDHMKTYVDECASNDDKNAAKVEVIADCFKEYRIYAEGYFPSEIKAEEYAHDCVDSFFKAHDTGIDYEEIVLHRVNEDEYKYLNKKCKLYSDIGACLNERYRQSFYDLRLSMLWKYPLAYKRTRDFVNSKDIHAQILDNPTNGLEETEIAMAYIVKHHPRQLGAYKCLHEDYLSKGFHRLFDRELPNIDYDDETDEEDECDRD